MEKGEFDDCILIFFNLVESLDVGSGNYVGEVNFNGRPHGYGDIKGVNLLNPPEMRNIHITGISMNEKSGLCKSLFIPHHIAQQGTNMATMLKSGTSKICLRNVTKGPCMWGKYFISS